MKVRGEATPRDVKQAQVEITGDHMSLINSSGTREVPMSSIGCKLDVVEKALADGRPYLTGPDSTVADAYLFVVVSWAL